MTVHENPCEWTLMIGFSVDIFLGILCFSRFGRLEDENNLVG